MSQATIVIPAHSEALVIGRLLQELTQQHVGCEFEIIVVCNGCTDDTARIARASGVQVIELDEASKHAALRAGDEAATMLPRVLLDADVEISAESIEQLVSALDLPGVMAAGPARDVRCDRSSWLVRAYYAVWEQLPAVADGLFGRGVMVLSKEAMDRVRELPPMLGDDLVVSESFGPNERLVVAGATVVIHAPRTVADLHRRRVRAATGNAQADAAGLRRGGSSLADLVHVVRADPRRVVAAVAFVLISLAGRIGARRAIRTGDFTTWGRDQSSRLPSSASSPSSAPVSSPAPAMHTAEELPVSG
jgi:glycosyltransferase involved in cell wall biosynthesis